jgi:hypothetical protein
LSRLSAFLYSIFAIVLAIRKQVPPLPEEEAFYKWINSALETAAKDPPVYKPTALAENPDALEEEG